MFGLFKKKNEGIKVTDKIWISENAKWQACYRMYQAQPGTVFLAWFEDSRNKLEQFFRSQGVTDVSLKLTSFAGINTTAQQLVFIEHHPLRQEEQDKFAALGLTEALVYSALDEPLFRHFGGDRITELMHKMGFKETEAIEHSMVTASIQKAQEKIAGKVLVSGNARSQDDWFLNAGLNL